MELQLLSTDGGTVNDDSHVETPYYDSLNSVDKTLHHTVILKILSLWLLFYPDRLTVSSGPTPMWMSILFMYVSLSGRHVFGGIHKAYRS
jgi:membrane protein YqaA with SNARE-associated domain